MRHFLAQFVRNLFANQPQRLGCVFGCDGVGRRGDRLERFDGTDFAENVGAALTLLDDSGFHAEMESGQVSGFFSFRVQDGHQSPEPAFGLAETATGMMLPRGGHCVGEFIGIVGRDEWLHQIQSHRLENGRFDFLVGYQGGNGEAGVVLDVFVRVEGQREEPHGHFPLHHRFLVLGASVQRQVGQGSGAVSQNLHICFSTFADNGVQTAELDDVAASHFVVLEQVFQEARSDSRLVHLRRRLCTATRHRHHLF